MSTAPKVTVVAVPRERFSLADDALATLIDTTDEPFELVVVDGNAPRRISEELERLTRTVDGTFVRTERYLSPNQARNLGMAHVDTPYVVFVDNDLMVTPGWLRTLVATAEETGAWLVGPLYFEGDPSERIIHMAGGRYRMEGDFGHRTFETEHLNQGVPLDQAGTIERGPCDFVEFHCLLARTSVFDEIGPLDEELLATREHLDLCLRVWEAGGEVWLEPNSHVTYVTPPPLARGDIGYFWTRWSEAWTSASLDRFCAVHGLDPSYRERVAIARRRRQVVFDPVHRAVGRVLGGRARTRVTSGLERVEKRLNERLVSAP